MERRREWREDENDSREPLPQPRQGFARWQDVEDAASQAVAPRRSAHEMDRSGERRYEAGLRRFVHDHERVATWPVSVTTPSWTHFKANLPPAGAGEGNQFAIAAQTLSNTPREISLRGCRCQVPRSLIPSPAPAGEG